MLLSFGRLGHGRRNRPARRGVELLECRRLLSAAATPAGPEFRANNTTVYDQLNPATAMDAAGNFVIVWQSSQQDDPNTSAWGVFGKRYGADGNPRGAEFRVNTTIASNQTDPAVAMDPAGDFVVAWESPDASQNGIFAQRFSAAGAKVGPEFQVNTSTAGQQAAPAVAIDADGDFVVAWQSMGQDDPPSSGYGVYAQRFNAAGVKQGGEFRANTFTVDNQFHPTVGMDAAGNFAVAWTSEHQLPVLQTSVYAQRYSASGAALGGEFRVPSFRDGGQVYPAAAMDPAGNLVIAWHGAGGQVATGSSSDIFFQRFDPGGARLGGEIHTNTVIPGAQAYAAVATDAAGDFVITWQSTKVNVTQGPTGIWGQRFTPSGAFDGGEFQVSTFADNQTLPAVAMDATGDFVVAWNSYGQDSTAVIRTGGVYAQRYAQANAAPRVTQVYARSTGWAAPFLSYLQAQGIGTSAAGFAVGGGAAQTLDLPWTGVNQFSVAFSTDVTATQAQLRVRGVNVANYPVTAYSYDPAAHTGTWTLGQTIANDKVILDLDGDAGTGVSAGGALLDGEWATGGAFPSGNGSAGGDFRFRVNVLPGDVNRSGGSVNAIDLSNVRARQLTSTSSPGTAPNTYNVFSDVNGSGNINAVDLGGVRANQLKSLPAAEPASADGLLLDAAPARKDLRLLLA